MESDESEPVDGDTDSLLPEDKPWRKGLHDFSAEGLKELKDYVEMYEPLEGIPVEQVRILLVGQIGGGKSSFINTISSICRGHVTTQAATGSDPEYLTTKYRCYEIRSGRKGKHMNFRLCDTRGLEVDKLGMDIRDFNYLLEGYIPDSFEFKLGQRLVEDIDLNKVPELKDRIHVVATVVNAQLIDFMPEQMITHLRAMRRHALERDIPVVVVLTHIDDCCPEVKADVTNVYRSVAVWEYAKRAAEIARVPLSQVIPIKNYRMETELDRGVDILALYALRQLIRLADNYLNEHMSKMGITLAAPEQAESYAPSVETTPYSRTCSYTDALDPDVCEPVDGDTDSLLPEDKPWRKGLHDFSAEELKELKDFVEMYEPLEEIPVQQVRILMVGHLGVGKSSFFNTINSIYRGYVTPHVPYEGDTELWTNKYCSYEIRSGRRGKNMNFRLYNTVGLTANADLELDVTDINYLLEGYAPDSKLMPLKTGQRLADVIDINKVPELKDKIHVLVIVVDGSIIDFLPELIRDKLRNIRQHALKHEIPIVLLLTHIDNICDEVSADVTKVYRSEAVFDAVEKAAEEVRMTPNQVIPIKNYESETELDRGVDILALFALRQMLRFADNFFDGQMTKLGIAKPGGATSLSFQYTKGRILGHGGYGTVFLSTRADTGQYIAMKQVQTYSASTESSTVKTLKAEFGMLSLLRHERIVEYYGSAMRGTLFNIFMEYMPGGSIMDQLQANGAFDEKLTGRYTRQALEGLVYLHDKAIIHRDVKGANILTDCSRNVKLCDFGTAKQLESVSNSHGATSHVGTPYWMSPEVIRNKPYGKRTDIWSLGCTVVEMITKHSPWHELLPVQAMFQIGNLEPQQTGYDLPANTSTVARDFLRRCFQVDASKRPSSKEMVLHDFCDELTWDTEQNADSADQNKLASLQQPDDNCQESIATDGQTTANVDVIYARDQQPRQQNEIESPLEPTSTQSLGEGASVLGTTVQDESDASK